MPQKTIGNWTGSIKATSGEKSRKHAQSKGNIIMDIAEKIRPHLTRLFQNVRDEEGKLLQPAHIRAIALNMAQDLIKRREATGNG